MKNFDIRGDEIHVWNISFLDFTNDIVFFTTLLSQEEIVRARAYKFLADQNRFILGRGLLRYLIAKYLNVQIQAVHITYGYWGKPCIAQKSGLYFNISHSGDYALYAFTRYHEVGIDLEYINANMDLDEIVTDMFSKEDLVYWETLREQDRVYSFFKYWVYKEAFLKANEKGWLSEKTTLSFKEISLFQQKLVLDKPYSKINYPYFFDCRSEYASALYVKGPPLRIKFFLLPYIY
jgi:4'-phosphopantetheinyl transferase